MIQESNQMSSGELSQIPAFLFSASDVQVSLRTHQPMVRDEGSAGQERGANLGYHDANFWS